MASRPVYIPDYKSGTPSLNIKNIDFTWFPGMSKSQKQKSILSLHQSANKLKVDHILEISSKSDVELGVNLSAFNLIITTPSGRSFSVETAFQSSKKFEGGGPYLDLLKGTSRQAKKDTRLKESGNLVEFVFFDKQFNLKPKTFFYDWLYVNALHQNKELADEVISFNGFTDIEFNPKKSINCQAYSVALYIALRKTKKLQIALGSPEEFKKILAQEYRKRDTILPVQRKLF